MDIKLKHRLVGACVILALAVFFLPMILDSEKYRQDIESQIPTDSVLQKGLSESDEQTNSAQTGSLTIDLAEDEPVKAIQKPTLNSKNTSQDSRASDSKESEKDVVEPSLGTSEAKVNDKIADGSEDKPSDSSNAATKTDVSQKTKSNDNSEPAKPTVAKTDDTVVSTKQSEVKTPKTTDKASEAKPQKAQAVKDDAQKPAFEETAWVIQIGSFSNKENATALVSELRNKGYRAYQRDAGKYSRVYVGPYPDKPAAESRVEALQGIVGSAVKVLQFDPQGH